MLCLCVSAAEVEVFASGCDGKVRLSTCRLATVSLCFYILSLLVPHSLLSLSAMDLALRLPKLKLSNYELPSQTAKQLLHFDCLPFALTSL